MNRQNKTPKGNMTGFSPDENWNRLSDSTSGQKIFTDEVQ